MAYQSRRRLVTILRSNRDTQVITVEALDNGDQWDLPYFYSADMPEEDILRYIPDAILEVDYFKDDPVQDTE